MKVFTEALQHDLRNRPDCRISAHLLIPGFVFTELTRGERTEKPAGAWTPEQTVDFLLASLERGDFYILCPDNDVPRALDEKRIAWAAGDIIENRPRSRAGIPTMPKPSPPSSAAHDPESPRDCFGLVPLHRTTPGMRLPRGWRASLTNAAQGGAPAGGRRAHAASPAKFRCRSLPRIGVPVCPHARRLGGAHAGLWRRVALVASARASRRDRFKH